MNRTTEEQEDQPLVTGARPDQSIDRSLIWFSHAENPPFSKEIVNSCMNNISLSFRCVLLDYLQYCVLAGLNEEREDIESIQYFRGVDSNKKNA